MPKVTQTASRKDDHIEINLTKNVHSGLRNGLERFLLPHVALPDLNLNEISLRVTFLKKRLNAPLLISSITGGTLKGKRINRILAQAAQETGIALGLGSIRPALENPTLAKTFQVRELAPDVFLMANLGAIQLNNGCSVEDCQRAVDMMQADALILHLNALQEAIQPEGNINFKGLLPKIEAVCRHLSVPVIAKEVGWGIDAGSARRLRDAGVAAIDVAGAGGTSWSKVERYRAKTKPQAIVAESFTDWGIPTAESLLECKAAAPGLPLIASGGIRDGVEAAKCIALGATLVGMAGPFLHSAVKGVDATIKVIDTLLAEMRIAMFAANAPDMESLAGIQILGT